MNSEQLVTAVAEILAARRARSGNFVITDVELESILRAAITPKVETQSKYPSCVHHPAFDSRLVQNAEEEEELLAEGWSHNKPDLYEPGFPKWECKYISGGPNPDPNRFFDPKNPTAQPRIAYPEQVANPVSEMFTAEQLLKMGYMPTKVLVHSREEQVELYRAWSDSQGSKVVSIDDDIPAKIDEGPADCAEISPTSFYRPEIKAGRGGYRPGAGRKPNKLKQLMSSLGVGKSN